MFLIVKKVFLNGYFHSSRIEGVTDLSYDEILKDVAPLYHNVVKLANKEYSLSGSAFKLSYEFRPIYKFNDINLKANASENIKCLVNNINKTIAKLNSAKQISNKRCNNKINADLLTPINVNDYLLYHEDKGVIVANQMIIVE